MKEINEKTMDTNKSIELEYQLEECKEGLYYYKMKELEYFCKGFKELIVKLLLLENDYDLTNIESYWFEQGHTKYGDIQLLMLDSIQVVKNFCNTLSYDLSHDLIKGLFNKQKYIDKISYCLYLFKILVKIAHDLKCNLQDAVDGGHPNGIDDIAMNEFNDMLKHSLAILENVVNNYECSSLRIAKETIERIKREYSCI